MSDNNYYLKVYLSGFRSGLFAKLKPTRFAVLLAIASYMDEDGVCYPTQKQLAERCGITRPTVNKAVKELLDFRFNGKPILTRKLVLNGKQITRSIYRVHPISQVAIFNGEVETI